MKAKRLFLLLTVVGMTTMSYGGTIPESFGCDSTITLKDGVKHSKEIFRYDEWGNAVYYAPYKWEANGWKADDTKQYVEYEYDAAGNRILWIYASWDNEAGDWIEYLDKWEYTYDGHNNLTMETYFSWDKETNSYVDNSYLWEKYEYEYNAQGKVTSRITYYWNETDGAWNNSPFYKNEYEYDMQGNRISEITYYYDSPNRWEISSSKPKIEYTYDTQGREIVKAFYDYVFSSTSYTKSDKYETVYDAQGHKASYSYYKASNNSWKAIPEWKEQYTYDARGNNTVMEYTDNSTSNESYKYTYGYDAAGKKISALYYGYKKILLGHVLAGNPPSWVPYYAVFHDWTYTTAYGYDSHSRPKTETAQSPAYDVQETQSGYNIIWKGTPDISVKTYYYSGGSNGIEPVVAGDDAVVSIRYYDLQGKVVAHPQPGRIYIAKEIHRSGKTTSRKIIEN